ncbi:MAG: hypothetical protein OHK0023_00340 [Anaerolineae bacterium]
MRRLTVLTFAVLMPIFAALILFAAPQRATSQTNTATPTGLSVPELGGGSATSTPSRSRLASPTPAPTEDIPAPLLTLTAFNAQIIGTFEAIPTATLGPSMIEITGKPHYVKFYADWCVPCRQMKPAVEAMKEKYAEELTFWEIDVDNLGSRSLVRRFQVEFIPYTVLLDKEGRIIEILEGLRSEAELDRAIQRLLRRGS